MTRPEDQARQRIDATLTAAGWLVQSRDQANPKEEPDVEFKYIDISGINNEQLRIVETKRYAGRDAPSRARQYA